MAPTRRQSTAKATAAAAAVSPQMPTPSTVAATPNVARTNLPSAPVSKLKIHPLLEVYEATISSLIGTLSEDPYRPEATQEYAQRLTQCEQELEVALEEVKQHQANAAEIQRLQKENTELSKKYSSDLTALSEARTLLTSLPESQPATIDNKIPYQQILEYASKLSKYTSPPPQWDPTRPQQPGTYVPWPSEDLMRRGRLAQLAVQGLPEPMKEEEQDTEMEETKPRRNPGRRATSVEARRRKMSEGGDPKPIIPRKEEMDLALDLWNPEDDV